MGGRKKERRKEGNTEETNRGRCTVYRTTEEEGVLYIGLRRRKVYCI